MTQIETSVTYFMSQSECNLKKREKERVAFKGKYLI